MIMMAEMFYNLLVEWDAILRSSSSLSLQFAEIAPIFLFIGLALLFLGIKLYRPSFAVLVFFISTAGLAYALGYIFQREYVVGIVAVAGIFLAFLAMFMKRVAIALTCAAFAAALASYLAKPSILMLIVIAIGALLLAVFKPRESYIFLSAAVGVSLITQTAPLIMPLPFEAISGMTSLVPFDLASLVPATLGFFVGILVQWAISHKGLDPVFTQKVALPHIVTPIGATVAALHEEQPGGQSEKDHAREVTNAPDDIRQTEEQPDETRKSDLSSDCDIHESVEPAKRDGIIASAIPAVSVAAYITKEIPIYSAQTRKEIKYRVTIEDMMRLRPLLDGYLEYDTYSGPNGYAVRSLYFDSLDDRDLYDKLDGVLEHKKIRIRSYDPTGDSFSLEYKCRWDTDGIKRKLILTREQAKRLVYGDYDVLHDFPEDPLSSELYCRMASGGYMPKVIVEYHRIAWTYPVSNVRVTWDSGISASYHPEAFFDFRPNFIPILPRNQGVLEVKYDTFFPTNLRLALNSIDQLPVSNSKYALARTYR